MVKPKGFGEGGPGNALFGMPAFDEVHEVCEILENIAPNVNEMQLFTDEAPDLCMTGKCLFIFVVVSILFYIQVSASSFHIFTPRHLPTLHLSLVRSSLPWSLEVGHVGSRACRSSGPIISDPR